MEFGIDLFGVRFRGPPARIRDAVSVARRPVVRQHIRCGSRTAFRLRRVTPDRRPTVVIHAARVSRRELVHLVLNFDPGVWTPRHRHGGQELVILTAGGITLQRRGATEAFMAGESWVNTIGLVHAAGDTGTDFAQAVATLLLPGWQATDHHPVGYPVSGGACRCPGPTQV
jgi:quercetin dioxygenase-like cupin family protein